MMNKFIKIFAGLSLVLALSSCGYDGHYRYPCQDPVNWEKSECKPPVCTVNGACPEDLVGNITTDGQTVTTDDGVVND
jgi:hypothetical protein